MKPLINLQLYLDNLLLRVLKNGDFSNSPGVKTSHVECGDTGLVPSRGIKILLCGVAKKNHTRLKTSYIHPTAIYVRSIVVGIETSLVYQKYMISAPMEPSI